MKEINNQIDGKKSVLRCKIEVIRHSYMKKNVVVDGNDLTEAYQNAIAKVKDLPLDKWDDYSPVFETKLIKRTIASVDSDV